MHTDGWRPVELEDGSSSSSDRLLWVWLSRLWPGWQDALEFVQPRTVIAWQKKRFRDDWRRLSQIGKPGRPALSKEVCELIQDMWRANLTWGSPRIVGELRTLGIHVAKTTVEKYRPRTRKPSSPTWKAFLTNHVKDIVATSSADEKTAIDWPLFGQPATGRVWVCFEVRLTIQAKPTCYRVAGTGCYVMVPSNPNGRF
jgi:hypothetical protein